MIDQQINVTMLKTMPTIQKRYDCGILASFLSLFLASRALELVVSKLVFVSVCLLAQISFLTSHLFRLLLKDCFIVLSVSPVSESMPCILSFVL